MVMLGECPACQAGNHKAHVRHYRPAGEGVMGGSMCPCKGECVDRGPSGNLRRVLDAISSARPR